jgi:hypothetical protein
MYNRKDTQTDMALHFGVNIGEISRKLETARKLGIQAAPESELPQHVPTIIVPLERYNELLAREVECIENRVWREVYDHFKLAQRTLADEAQLQAEELLRKRPPRRAYKAKVDSSRNSAADDQFRLPLPPKLQIPAERHNPTEGSDTKDTWPKLSKLLRRNSTE